MERLTYSRIIRILSIFLVSTAALYGLTNQSPAYAGAYTLSPTEKLCMADAYLLEPGNSLPQDALNCTANDVEITQVIPLDPNAECNLGETFSFQADVTVRTNANERYDTTFYLPLTEQSPQVVQGNFRNCSMILPIPGDSGETADVDIDGDACGDITKALGPDQYTLTNETITMLCSDDDGDNRADFTYCAAWDNQERDNCTAEEDPYAGQIPNTKSKCNCDTFNIDVFIKPAPPVINKSEGAPTSRPEPGGEFTFDLSFTNPNSQTSLFISALSDEIDINGDGTYDATLDLWGPTSAPGGEGVYLTATNCAMGTPYEVLPSATYSCQFTVHIVDRNLPDDQSPEYYKDVVKVTLEDKNGDPVVNGATCPLALGAVAGEHCSVERQVSITNLPPDISVTKTANPTSVLEPGDYVEFTVVVTNEAAVSDTWDSPLIVTSLTDTDFDLLNVGGPVTSTTCATGASIPAGGTYTCTFTALVEGDFLDPAHSNTVTAVARDDEYDTDEASGTATVSFTDVPSIIALIKTAGGQPDGVTHQVPETGDSGNFEDVVYKFEFSVDAASVDSVTFDTLEDVVDPNGAAIFSDLTSQCNVDYIDGNPLGSPIPLGSGVTLLPGQYASCEITLQVQGNAGDVLTNLATIRGVDSDGAAKNASDPADVEFLDVPLQITPEVAMKARVFVRLPNTGIDNVTVTALTIGGTPLTDGASGPAFEIINETALGFGPYGAGDGPYVFCTAGLVIDQGTTTECGFTIKLYPGFETGLPNPDIEQLFTGPDGLIFTFDDGDGSPVNELVEFIFVTNEP
ncbi:hypothetical protein [Vibrio sp. CAU 1672]|uniref:hypothetical protein n=1 Tax=Vibrio sp. CAU 1672 TaxID=3032594 RepID=UPI0023DBC11C|nr:hypothetical protein [Vibrio sp. CAU 1672]MDF2154568.1 hypothetical protein [Vibrio sp. CAU 1672]